MRQLLINIFRERFYLMIKRFITETFCLMRGIANRGINVSISPRAKIKGGHRIRLGNNALIERDVMLNAGEPNSFIEIGADTWLFYHCMLSTAGGWIKIGRNCTVNRFAVLYGHGGLEIGNWCRCCRNKRYPSLFCSGWHTCQGDKEKIINEDNNGCRISVSSMPRKGISIIIPNWNGKPLLERNLPFLLEALSSSQ